MECQVEKNDNFLHLLFAYNQGSKGTKAAVSILVNSTNEVLKILLNVWKKL